MRPSWTSSAACLLLISHAAAFYMYKPPYMKGDVPNQRRTVQAVQQRAPDSSSDSITLPLRRTPVQKRDNKYNIVTAQTPTQTNSVGIDQDGMDYTYFSPMMFGSSNEVYHMLMDTAASNTWVMSSQCTTDVCNEHNTLGTAQSSSLKLGSTSFSITYGTGSINGTTASDIAHFAGLSVSLTFGLATGVSPEFADYALDGILGFGRGSPDPDGTDAPSIIDVLASNGLVKSKLIGVHLSRAADPPNDGEMNLGAPNPSLYDGDLSYVSAIDNSQGFWEIPVDDAGYNGKMAGFKGQSAILDTGTSFLLLPPDAAATLHQQIPGSAQGDDETFTVPCSSTDPVQMVFGGKTYNISSADYVGSSAGNGACHSNIIGRQTFGPDQWLIGDVFLKNVYTVFDFDGARIGFGVKGSSSITTQQTSSSSTATQSGMPTSFSLTGGPTNASGSATMTTSVSSGSVTPSPIAPGSATPSGTAASQTNGQSPSSSNTAGTNAHPTSMSALAVLVAIGSLVVFV